MGAPSIAEEAVDGATDGPDSPDVGGEDSDSLSEAKGLAEEAADGEPNVAEVDLSDDDLGSGDDDLFTGTEDVQQESDGDDDGDQDDDDGEPELDGLDQRGESLEKAVNEGAARLAVVGLDDDEADGLEQEFTEVFEAFRLGYFGSRFAEEYVFVDDEDEVDPTWGLLGAVLVSAALVVWMRPDGDEITDKLREAVSEISGGMLE